MPHRVTLIPGDGIGPEISDATRRVLEATGVTFDWDVREAGADVMAKHGGNPLPESVIESIAHTGVAIKGPITTPVGTGFRSVNVALRKALDLFAQVRPCKSYAGVRSRYDDVDLVIVRENTEDLYAGIEFEEGTDNCAVLRDTIQKLSGAVIREDAGISIKPISIEGTRRVVQFALDYARREGRRKVTVVHKANIMKHTDGLWLRVAREVAEGYSDIEFEDRIVDNMCMQLVQKPELYDVMVLPNLYGDIVSDLAAGLVGGLGVAPGANYGRDAALFEPTHGSAPKYAGQNKVNPTAMMLSGVLMLRHLGERNAADRMEAALAAVIAEGKDVTYDLKPKPDDPTAVGTSQFADAVIARLQPEQHEPAGGARGGSVPRGGVGARPRHAAAVVQPLVPRAAGARAGLPARARLRARLRALRAGRAGLRVAADGRPRHQPRRLLPAADRRRRGDRPRPRAERAAAGLALRRLAGLVRGHARARAFLARRRAARRDLPALAGEPPRVPARRRRGARLRLRGGHRLPRLPRRAALAGRLPRPHRPARAHPRARGAVPARALGSVAADAPVRRQPGGRRAVAARRLVDARRALHLALAAAAVADRRGLRARAAVRGRLPGRALRGRPAGGRRARARHVVAVGAVWLAQPRAAAISDSIS